LETADLVDVASGGDASMQALALMLEAWDEGAEAGVAPELMAYAALYTALTDLVSRYGEDAVAVLADGLVTRVQSGEFTLVRNTQ